VAPPGIQDNSVTIPFKEAPLTPEVSFQSHSVNLPNQDFVDRFLAATAMVYELTLVTADERLIRCGQVSTLPN
jgi:PIN domain nuclease of toxin-antitoxin system